MKLMGVYGINAAGHPAQPAPAAAIAAFPLARRGHRAFRRGAVATLRRLRGDSSLLW